VDPFTPKVLYGYICDDMDSPIRRNRSFLLEYRDAEQYQIEALELVSELADKKLLKYDAQRESFKIEKGIDFLDGDDDQKLYSVIFYLDGMQRIFNAKFCKGQWLLNFTPNPNKFFFIFDSKPPKEFNTIIETAISEQ
jgi:hypothetical protein